MYYIIHMYINCMCYPFFNYVCAKVNNTMKETMCGPMFSLFHMMSNIYQFDIEYISTFNLKKWNQDLFNKVIPR